VERLVQVYKSNASGLQTFLRDKFARRAGNGSCVEEKWKYFSRVSDVLFHIKFWGKKKIPDPECYG